MHSERNSDMDTTFELSPEDRRMDHLLKTFAEMERFFPFSDRLSGVVEDCLRASGCDDLSDDQLEAVAGGTTLPTLPHI